MDQEIVTHVLASKHTKLSEEEVKQVLDKYNISLTQLPKISRKDPAIKHLETNSGDIIKILRKSGTAGKAVYYRTVYD